jgi:UDP-galactose transporter
LVVDVDDEPVMFTSQPTAWESPVSSARIKWIALTILFFQNSGTSLIMPLAQAGGHWNSQSGVIVQEVIKGTICALVLLRSGGVRALRAALRPTREAFQTALPALLFLAQNNLQYLAAKHLDATIFAVLFQLKTLATALLSVLVLGKRLGPAQWLALFILVGGAACMVLDQDELDAGADAGGRSVATGVVAVVTSCVFSGLSGVYFEKILKDSTVSLAARNVQLACYSCAIGLTTWYQSGGSPSQFFSGYSTCVWLAICNNALGGLLVAAVVKYADNILKNFANTLAIVNTTVVSTAFLGGSLGPQSALGVGMVISSIFVYAETCSLGCLAEVPQSVREGRPCRKLKLPCRNYGKSKCSPRGSPRGLPAKPGHAAAADDLA